ncbi:hypothetical protein [Aquabacterium sp. J223]|uniref:hypothetical protein n=1 Tax=Aquabacterium sp. J223 TaxID=2898431 RepID=UPI0021ADB231|nr:hypothetical protein [Aquabacterium sp. J223]UUX94283.1 hypothetical protein LRS07_13190 [Aquabacterium sp. J223]
MTRTERPTPPVAPAAPGNPPGRRADGAGEGEDRHGTADIDGRSSQRRDDAPEPRLPHERDESADSQQHQVPQVTRQAAEDVARGLRDTSRAEATDRAYREQQRDDQGRVDDRRGVDDTSRRD